MRTRLALAAAILVLLASAGLVLPAGATDRSEDAPRGWTSQRMADAIPRDLVVDDRGLGYLRLPDGALEPYGHRTPARIDLRAEPVSDDGSTVVGRGRGGDGAGPAVSDVDPAAGDVIGASHRFEAVVADPSGVRSVFFAIELPGGSIQRFPAPGDGGVHALDISGFTPGEWRWWVIARDASSRRGELTISPPVPFTVDTDGGPGITDEPWELPGTVKEATGRVFFSMPYIGNVYADFICSGTVVTDETTGRSVILTAAHCVYNDERDVFARDVIFIPNQDETTGDGSDRDCSNDPRGCWVVSHGVVESNYTRFDFPANNAWDYAYYVVDDIGSHQGNGPDEALDAFVDMPISFAEPDVGAIASAIGYSGARDPDLRYCEEPMSQLSAINWFLASCGLTGGSSGGPWIQGPDGGDPNTFPIISVNSWGYTSAPGMAGPMLSGTTAECLFATAKTSPLGADVVVDPATC